jgi:hypothetical protein
MLSVGDMVVPNLQEERKLLLWSDGKTPITVVAEVGPESILMIIEVQRFDDSNKQKLQPEWEHSSCLLLGPQGEIGWTGTGWITKITNEFLDRQPLRSEQPGHRIHPAR